MSEPVLRHARGRDDMAAVRVLFLEYARSLNFSLCFQGFDEELAALPGCYAEPRGCILLAEADGQSVGIVALRPLGDEVCEMKRLYVQPVWRGRGLGARLARAIIDEAARRRYRAMRLDTHESMQDAVCLYRALGFVPIPAYYSNPLPDIYYFEKPLAPPGV